MALAAGAFSLQTSRLTHSRASVQSNRHFAMMNAEEKQVAMDAEEQQAAMEAASGMRRRNQSSSRCRWMRRA